MATRRGKGQQKGPQDHAEGGHGPKTEAELRREFQSSMPEEPVGERPEDELKRPGAHPLMEGREQHDEADLNADKTRLSRKIERDDLDRSEYQVKGGDTRHPALPPEN
jgi:hypothetical protein